MFFVYKVGNTVNDLLYVGRTNNLEKRWLKHKNEATRGSGMALHSAMRQYGIDNFYPEIIEECPDYSASKSRETYWIRILNTTYPQGYNMQVPCLTDTEAAVVRYDAWNWSLEAYAQYFGMSIATLRGVRSGASHFHVTQQHLPK